MNSSNISSTSGTSRTSGTSDSVSSRPRGRALVLGGGGSAGNAWLIGVIAGLCDVGLDVADADLLVGTSAGATAAAQIAMASPAELLAAVDAEDWPAAGEAGPGRSRLTTIRPPSNHMEVMTQVIAAADDPADMRRGIGAAALERDAANGGSTPNRWRDTVAARLPAQRWPRQRLMITAIDADTGEPVVFTRESGVELVDAVAASTSNGFGGPPYRIGERRYLDGGYRRNENADLATGCDRVLVLSPLGGRTLHPHEWGMQLSAQVEELRDAGSTVETILPDDASLEAFGGNMMDLSTRPPAARAGYEQGRRTGKELDGFWLGTD